MKHVVIVRFLTPNQSVPILAREVNWLDRKAVRQFAADASAWLIRGVGYRVVTETWEIA